MNATVTLTMTVSVCSGDEANYFYSANDFND